MKAKNILITGGSGFIGNHMVRKFSEEAKNVIIFDINEPVYDLNENAKFIKGDIFDLSSLKAVIEEADVIIHLVGLADSGVAQQNPMKSFQLNVISLQNVLEMCRITGGKKIIFPSSAAIYGITETLPIKETFAPNPTNIYASHKYICEKLIEYYQQNYGIPYVILRFFNVYGKGNEGIIGIFLENAKKGIEITSYGPYQYRDFIYAGELADAVSGAVKYDKAVNKTINVGSGYGTQMKEILEIVCEIYPDTKWKEIEATFTMYDSIADITQAKILLGFEPHGSKEFMKDIILKEMM